jgi:hypothetical protein
MTHHDGELQQLLDDLKRARSSHRDALRGRVDTPHVESTRADTLVAAEAYVSALHERRLPIPPRLHRDLVILRILCAPPGRRSR